MLQALKIYYISTFFGVFLPATVGGDALRVYSTVSNNHPMASVVSSVLVERFLGLVNLFLYGTFGLILFLLLTDSAEIDLRNLLVLIASLTVLATLGFLVSFSSPCRRAIHFVFGLFEGKRFVGSLATSLKRVYDSYGLYEKSKSTLWLFFILTSFETTTAVLRSYLVALSVGVEVDMAYYFAFVPITLILTRLPISFNGFGVKEGSAVYFLSLKGISSSLGFAYGLLDHLVNMLVGAVPGGLLFVLDRRTLEREPEREFSE